MGISQDSRHKRRKSGGRLISLKKKRAYEFGRQPTNTKIGPKKVTDIRTRGGHTKTRALRLETGNFSWGTEAVTRKTRIINVLYNATNNELVRTNTLVKGSVVAIDAGPFRQWYFSRYGLDLSLEDPKVKGLPKAPKQEKAAGEPQKKDAATSTDADKGKGKKKKLDKQARAAKAKEAREKEAAEKKAKEESQDHKKKQDHYEIKPVQTHILAKRRQRLKGQIPLESAVLDQFRQGRLYAVLSSSPGQVGRADGYILEGEELGFYLRKMVVKKKK
eukprot:TRINITY_DN70_c0_g1_i1.p1 TRINITY_DN70_c0_g1~~TRINITY_DN70_c0_g1_i1.p1  ORF type:complete len:275 (+),score=72.95 TRINITY_DN70_c0_g1_i1:56-880(+)